MDFTREPIIETVITPREGYRLVVRSSKNMAQEEHFVEALEVVSFGVALFFRSRERPKPFIIPVTDYEVLEVREPRMVLKTQGAEKQPALKVKQEPKAEVKAEPEKKEQEPAQELATASAEPRGDRRRERRRSFRRRRGQTKEEAQASQVEPSTEGVQEGEVPLPNEPVEKILSTAPLLSSILPPPTRLIRDHLEDLRKEPAYKEAFFQEKGVDDDALLAELRANEDGAPEVASKEPFRDDQEAGEAVLPYDPFADQSDTQPKPF